MNEIMGSSFGAIGLTSAAFLIAQSCQRKWKLAILNPILVSAVLVGVLLAVLNIPVSSYQSGCQMLSFLITPATICLAISLYMQLQKLKGNFRAVLVGVICGTVSTLIIVLGLSRLFGLPEQLMISLLPKGVTTAIGVSLSEEAGGIGAVTTAAIIVTGVLGNMFGPLFCRLFRITDPIAQGAAYGTAAHAIGTAKANECGELTGAVSSFSLTVSGILTSVFLSLVL